ncbi:hypothetical protein B0J13DRAFT_527396 [Dactylonectria estremocensis]|uniref:Fucose-specific lectin n=1 Tax=Dactylonectria estremocensis TaxID=1079267 RepID=A0A9P9EMD6_9HYPO|nr:hypothetical protein B0J13DRAFT_527396 [Dactylonectria estremocensis]
MASPSYSDLPEAYGSTNADPSKLPPASATTSLPEVYGQHVPNPSQLPHVTETTNLPEVLEGPKPYYEVPDHERKLENGDTLGERRIWGIKRKTFFILLVVIAVVVIGGAVGGAVGATVGKGDSESSPSSDDTATTTSGNSPTSTSSSSILPDSQLASVNWTDSSGYAHYYLFYQNNDKMLINSIWDSENKTWEARSLSASLNSSGVNIDIHTGSSIAAVAWNAPDDDWNLKVYVIRIDNAIVELTTEQSTVEAAWKQGGLGTNKLIAAEGSNLAAWHPNVGNSSWHPETVLLWQDDEQDVKLSISGGNWNDGGTITQAMNSTGLAITAIQGIPRPEEIRWRVFYDSSDKLRAQLISTDLDLEATKPSALRRDLPQDATSNYAVLCINEIDILAVNLGGDGSLVARYSDNSIWSDDDAPTLHGSPSGISASSNFTAIAAHAGRRVYGIVDGEIHEWKFSDDTPMDWTYVGQVNTTVSN